MTRCCVPQCFESGGHRFPKNFEIRRLWLKAIRRENFIPTDCSRLCRSHFTDDDYLKASRHTGIKHQHNILRKSAVPSIFPWNKSGSKKFQGQYYLENENMKAIIQCSVPQCKSNDTLSGITFHPFPKNESIKKKWIKFFNINEDVTKSMKVCSLHFNKTDFVPQDASPELQLLRRNAIPVKQTKILQPSVEYQNMDILNGNINTMNDTTEPAGDLAQEENVPECRTCLKKCEKVNSLCSIFQAWSPPWVGMGATIAEDLARIANIEVNVSDIYPNAICHTCYKNLLDAAMFVANVRVYDTILKQRFLSSKTAELENNWPKPIQIDKNINGDMSMDVDIKQEVISDEDYNDETGCMDSDFTNVDIKIEPEEIEEPPPMQITINGTMSLDPNTNNSVLNGIMTNGEQHLEVVVKQEPVSDDDDSEAVPDLPLECLLCAKKFNSVSGLKAHVIAQHSYKSVKRKLGSQPSPEKIQADRHVCQICRRSFATSTDLMVHETCHNKYSCYVCGDKFDTFELLTKHRKRCKASSTADASRTKTLDDVIRPHQETVKESIISSNNNSDQNVDAHADTNIQLDSNPVTSSNPTLDKPATDTIPTSDITPMEDIDKLLEDTTASPDITPTEHSNKELEESTPSPDVAENTPSLGVPSTEDINTVSEHRTDGNKDNSTDSSMKLHLEIHSANEAVPMELNHVEDQNTVEMQMESLYKDQ